MISLKIFIDYLFAHLWIARDTGDLYEAVLRFSFKAKQKIIFHVT